MPISQYWRSVWQRASEYAVYDDFSAETKAVVDQYADEAYRYCVRWFGSPKDAHKGWKVVQGEQSFFRRSFGKPMITISKHATSKEQLCGDIAHEMYHRVTEGRKGLADELWVKETMAVLTSQWFQQNQGFKDYMKRLRETSIADDGRAVTRLGAAALLSGPFTEQSRQYRCGTAGLGEGADTFR